MQDNPYNSPKSQPIDVPTEVRGSRPISVWLLLLLLVIFTALFGLGYARLLGYVLPNFTALGGGWMLVYSIVWRFALLAAGLAAIYSAFKGRQYGRWIGVLAIVGIAAAATFFARQNPLRK